MSGTAHGAMEEQRMMAGKMSTVQTMEAWQSQQMMATSHTDMVM